MVLNRVLLLAACITLMLCAMVFTISCSGDDGKDGKDGKSCTAEEKANGGVDIICDGVVRGTLIGNGEKGEQGIQGPKGEPGSLENLPDGACFVKKYGSSWHAFCDEVDAGIIANEGEGPGTPTTGGCSVVSNLATDPFLVVFTCGSTEIYMCGGELFDPSGYNCSSKWVQGYLNSGLYSGVSDNEKDSVLVPFVQPSLCNGNLYDMRKEFCDDSPSTPLIKPFCGPVANKVRYRTGPLPHGGESCNAQGQVVRACGSGTSAPTYRKADQFCMTVAGTGTQVVTDRCGVPNAKGIYNSGKHNESGDKTWIAGFSGITGGVEGLDYLDGEYNTGNKELCVNKKVVKVCKANPPEYYDEKIEFCAAGDIIAPHCTDRVTYEPLSQYCSFMGNSFTNIKENIGNGFFNFDGSSNCGTDDISKCLKYASTAVNFCGDLPSNGVPTYTNTPNLGSWKWEYCIRSGTQENNMRTTNLRCSELQVPTDSLTPVCRCIKDSRPISVNTNGCECDRGYKFKEVGNIARGLLKYVDGQLTEATKYPYEYDRGGECVWQGGTATTNVCGANFASNTGYDAVTIKIRNPNNPKSSYYTTYDKSICKPNTCSDATPLSLGQTSCLTSVAACTSIPNAFVSGTGASTACTCKNGFVPDAYGLSCVAANIENCGSIYGLGAVGGVCGGTGGAKANASGSACSSAGNVPATSNATLASDAGLCIKTCANGSNLCTANSITAANCGEVGLFVTSTGSNCVASCTTGGVMGTIACTAP